MSNNQFDLLKQKKFLPLFLTQFLSAFNDNIYKNAIVILITFGITTIGQEDSFLVNLSAGIFILPFFLFSATAGQLADKYDKSLLIRKLKALEILIMLFGAIFLYYSNITFLFIILFFMGAQSAFFGPLKYGILPQHLDAKEIVGGNALIETGTFLAILFGTILGGVLVTLGGIGKLLTGLTVIIVALLGYYSARFIPKAESVDNNLKINWNIFSATKDILLTTKSNHNIFLSVLGISWFWFFGAVILAQLPSYTKNILNGSEEIVTMLLVVFSIGIAIGSLCCEKLANYRIELGLVPLGALGLTIFTLDLGYISTDLINVEKISTFQLLTNFTYLRILFDIFLISFSGGIFIVPLYAFVQEYAEQKYLSRIIAGNNIINALFMVLASVFAILFFNIGYSISHLFILIALINILVAIYIFKQVPEFAMRLIIWLLIHTIYRLKKQELDHIPEKGAAVIVANHVSFVDALIILSASRRPIRFVMDHEIFKLPLLNFVFKTAKTIPIASAKINPELLNKAYDTIAEALDNGELVCIFPEGKITHDGELNTFKTGIEKIIARTPVPAIPIALCGLYGSFFSRVAGKAMRLRNLPGKLFHKISIKCAPAISPEKVSAELLHERVLELRGEFK
jgi:1-acyl-sn-glycerol-3-phosphate acyltransferase